MGKEGSDCSIHCHLANAKCLSKASCPEVADFPCLWVVGGVLSFPV